MYPNEKCFWVSVQDMKSAGILDSNINEYMMKSHIRFAQHYQVRKLIGSDLYNTISDMINDPANPIDLPENSCYKDVLEYMFFIIAHTAKAYAMRDYSDQFRNAGVTNASDEGLAQADYNRMIAARDQEFGRAGFYITEFAEYLKCNCGKICELGTFNNWWGSHGVTVNPDHKYIHFPQRRGGSKCCR